MRDFLQFLIVAVVVIFLIYISRQKKALKMKYQINRDIRTNQILSIPDSTKKIIALHDYVFNFVQNKGVTNLSDTEKVIFCVEELEKEINNGGFNQWFFNSSADYWYETITALEKIEADNTSDLVKQALTVFPNSEPPKDAVSRQKLVNNLSDKQNDLLNSLDQQFYKYEDNISALLMHFVEQHKEDIKSD